jgi:hypothetical protein
MWGWFVWQMQLVGNSIRKPFVRDVNGSFGVGLIGEAISG